jgi:Transposase DDE domain
MYIRKSSRLHNGKTYTNHVLVESVMTPKGPRQKTICSLGDLGPRPREDWLKLARKIEDALSGQHDLLDADAGEVADIVTRARARRPGGKPTNAAALSSPPRQNGAAFVKVDPSRVTTERHREAGPVHVGYQFWKRLELDRILQDCKLSPAVRRLACVMTLNRLIAPTSEHAMPDWIRRTALADILDADFDEFEEDPLYQVLDKLHTHRAAIQTALVARERSLFDLDQTVYLYDLTSTYFEGVSARNDKAKRGYSRDHRHDCKQLVVGLVLNRDGFASTHEIFAGNTQDQTTLATMLDRLGEHVELKPGSTVVIDRGMAFDENIADIKQRKLHYVVASRQPERDRWLAEFDDTDGFIPVLRQPSPLNPAQKKTSIEVKICTGDDEEGALSQRATHRQRSRHSCKTTRPLARRYRKARSTRRQQKARQGR